MRHLEHLGPQVRAAVEEVGLGVELHVPGQQDATGGRGRAEHHGRVVHGGAVLAVDVLRCAVRGQDVECQGGPRQAPARRHLQHRRSGLRGLLRDPTQGAGRLVRRSQCHPTGRPAPQRAREPAHVVGVQVGHDHQRQRVDPEATQAGVRRTVVRARVDEDRLPGHARGEDQRVALSDVAGDHDPVGGRPAGADHAGRHQDQRQPDHDRQDEEPGTAVADEHHQHEQHAGEQQRTARTRGPGEHGTGDRGGAVGDQHEPRDGGSGEPCARGGGGRREG
ncbi:hypothetical protein GCM10023215_05760 [Pseudonocardia yuanmonensis]|uniref:Uncharacterized protein n=1 Tax=Pseudonocardia yuanmonensis TaxID=1095914 RepID=A0ABP8VZB1_9PSEU